VEIGKEAVADLLHGHATIGVSRKRVVTMDHPSMMKGIIDAETIEELRRDCAANGSQRIHPGRELGFTTSVTAQQAETKDARETCTLPRNGLGRYN